MSESGKFCYKRWIIVFLVNGYVDNEERGVELSGSVMPSPDVCRRARESRDPRFDGRFFIGVLSTGIYCRTTCPARMPKEENVRYYPTAAAAQDQGFRPCRRCRPESAQRLPEWTISSDTVQRALRNIEAGFLNKGTVGELAQSLNVSERHLGRLFQSELGASPNSVAQLCRAKLARKLLQTTTLKVSDIAFHAGFGSVSRFNASLNKIYQQSPKEIRNSGSKSRDSNITITLPVRGPYDHDWMFEYLKRRSLTLLEQVSGGPGSWAFTRKLACGAQVRVEQGKDGLIAHLPLVEEPLHSLLTRIRRVFDLNADGDSVHDHLSGDPLFGRWVSDSPGLRVPGAWDGFETAVRAVLGQQVSVERGTELANKMIERYGEGDFPSAEVVATQDIAEIGMPGQRGRAIAELANRVANRELILDDCQDYGAAEAALLDIKGIGPWTTNYIRMRVLKDPNAFPDNDWVVLKTLDCTAAQARKVAERWQPWRAYGLMYLWYASTELRAERSALRKK